MCALPNISLSLRQPRREPTCVFILQKVFTPPVVMYGSLTERASNSQTKYTPPPEFGSFLGVWLHSHFLWDQMDIDIHQDINLTVILSSPHRPVRALDARTLNVFTLWMSQPSTKSCI